MRTPKINLEKFSNAGRASAFSTETISKGQTPKILNEYREKCRDARQKCEIEVQARLKKIEKKIDDWENVRDPINLKKACESKFNSFLNFTSEKYRTSLKAPYDDYKKREIDYIDFKRQNNITQEPLRAGFKTWAWGFLLILFGVELYANYQ